MILHLLNDRTALALDDKRDTVTVSPETRGVLVVEGAGYRYTETEEPIEVESSEEEV